MESFGFYSEGSSDGGQQQRKQKQLQGLCSVFGLLTAVD
jgi:hypothetical protein